MNGPSAEETFNLLYRKYYKQAYSISYSIIRDPYLAQDAVQETFMKVFTRLDSIREEGNTEAWIKMISRNRAIDHYRKRRDRPDIADAYFETKAKSADSDIERFIEKAALAEMLECLEPALRQSLILAYWHGMSYEQLARHQMTTVSAVKAKIHRAKRKLRSQFGARGDTC